MERDLTGAALHRMSQPLTVLRGSAELALIRPLSAAEYREAILTMARETERLVALAEALRALHQPPVAPEAPPDPLARLQAELPPLAQDRGVQLELAWAGWPAAWTEPILQLVHGALQRARTRVTLAGDGADAVIADDGPPLDAAAWDKAFDPFANGADIAAALRAALARRQLQSLGAAVTADAGGVGGNRLRIRPA